MAAAKAALLLFIAVGVAAAFVPGASPGVILPGEGAGPGAGAQPATADPAAGLSPRRNIRVVVEKVSLTELKNKPACSAGAASGFCVPGQQCTDAGGAVNPGKSGCKAGTVCCAEPAQGEKVYSELALPPAGPTSAGVTPAGATVTTSANNFTAPPSTQLHAVPFAPQTAVYWPLKLDKAARNYSVICYHKSAKDLTQYPEKPVAGTTESCSQSGGKQCFKCSTRVFFAMRSGGKRYHSGVDLYAARGTPVIAAEAGKVVNVYPFYENVCCVIVQNDSGTVINYGEISCDIDDKKIYVGARVEPGDQIGEVGHLKCCHPMMHFETYVKGTTQNLRSRPGKISASLLDPTHYLLNAFENGK